MRDDGEAKSNNNKKSTRRIPPAVGRGLLFDPIVRKWKGVQCTANTLTLNFWIKILPWKLSNKVASRISTFGDEPSHW